MQKKTAGCVCVGNNTISCTAERVPITPTIQGTGLDLSQDFLQKVAEKREEIEEILVNFRTLLPEKCKVQVLQYAAQLAC